LIKDRISGVSFSFLTDEEIQKLSVVEVRKTQTFDQLGNPYPEGLHDKRMGVSPFDKNSGCPTCGLTSNYCPGHHGHIQLVAPIYNPFMIKDLYRLMKSKCFHCHRLRIHESKLNVFVHSLKLIKAGEIVGSQRIKNYFLSLAKDISSQL
jgi:DNA-directed RNA polymerase I subunit RPA1